MERIKTKKFKTLLDEIIKYTITSKYRSKVQFLTCFDDFRTAEMSNAKRPFLNLTYWQKMSAGEYKFTQVSASVVVLLDIV